MTQPIYCDPSRRHDFVLLFDVVDGNPNGDPDAGNLPRVDPETMQGLVTDVAIKRKVRDFVDMTHGTEERNKIYVQSKDALNTVNQRAYTALGLQSTGVKQKSSEIDAARSWMCANFYDIRMFGAVMTTKVNCGQVRGPIQLTFARSIDPVTPLDVSITRIAVTREEDRESKLDDHGEDKGSKQSEMGRKAMVPYGLYRAHGFFNPHFAVSTGVISDDLALFWQALQTMWDYDRSAARGMMSCRGISIFSHSSSLGNAPAHTLFEGVQIDRTGPASVARQFSDYKVDYTKPLPDGVELNVL